MDAGNTLYESLRKAPRQRLADVVPIPAPFTVYLELTNVCNFKCTYCPLHYEDYYEIAGGHHSLSETQVALIYENLRDLGKLKTLNFYYLGEPFVNRKLTQFVGLAKKMNIAERTIVTTNGTLVTEAVAHDVVESGLDFIRFSVYGTTQDELKTVAGTKFPLDRIVDNVRLLRRIRDSLGQKTPHIYIKMIDTGVVESNLRFYQMFRDLADEAKIEPAMNWSEDVNNVNLSGLGADLLNTPYFENKKEVCPFPFYTLAINADLKVTVCCVDWKKDTEIGSLSQNTLREIWQGEKMHKLRMAHLARKRHEISACASCTFLHTAPDNLDSLSEAEYRARVEAYHTNHLG